MPPKKKKVMQKWKLSTQTGTLIHYVTSLTKCDVSVFRLFFFFHLTRLDVSFQRHFTCSCASVREKTMKASMILYLNYDILVWAQIYTTERISQERRRCEFCTHCCIKWDCLLVNHKPYKKINPTWSALRVHGENSVWC